jgi:Zinc finger, C3HC4 type (RING finger)
MATIQCNHKSQIGCALTATETCCSCSDQRPLASAYPIYIDGQGMKMAGKRWTRYCWKCRDYWTNEDETHHQRRPSFSRARSQSPTWRFPPRPGPSTSTRRRRTPSSRPIDVPVAPALMYESVNADLRAHPPLSLRGGAGPRNRTSGRQRREAPAARTSSPQPNQSPNNLRERSDTASEPVIGPRTQRRRRQNPFVAFGTAEEIQSEDYQSPLSTMFGRAWDRYRTAETTRRELEAEQSELEQYLERLSVGPRPGRELVNRHPNPFQPREEMSNTNPLRLLPSNADPSISSPAVHADDLHPGALPAELEARRAAQRAAMLALRVRAFNAEAHGHPRQANPSPPRPNPIDTQSRPPALSASDMTVSIACRICNEQRSDTLTDPCMHICMCHWCSEIIKNEAATARRNSREHEWRCPICRTDIKQVRRVYLC